jgi:hypothetical protein
MNHKVYAPNLHLFAFHLIHGSTNDSQTEPNYDSELLWHKCSDIFTKFHIDKEVKIRKVSEDSRINLLEETSKSNILLPLEGKIFLNHEKQVGITGCACALQIYDSYALGLNLRIPELDEKGEKTEEVDIAIFKHFNPDKCFLPNQINSSLGQTLLLTVWLSPEQQQNSNLWREIADESLQNFLGEAPENCPPVYQEGQLFGSPIFEYGIPSQNHVYGHSLVWLFLGEIANGKYAAKADENLSFFYQEFIDLFFYRSKVIKAYQISREVYTDILRGYQKIKQMFEDIEQNISSQAQSLSEAEMGDFKNKLRTMPKLALQYSDWLRDLEKYRLTIEINAKNYTEKLRQIQEKLPNEDLRFLSLFNQEICSKFQQQIQVDLGYFLPSSDLIDKAIASIRGIVEIEQAESDRSLAGAMSAKEEAEREREKKLEESRRKEEKAAEEREKRLQLWIALVGTGLTVSGISAQTAAKPVETILTQLYPKQSLDCPKAGLVPCLSYSGFYVLFHVGIGVIAASILGLIIWLVSKTSKRTS